MRLGKAGEPAPGFSCEQNKGEKGQILEENIVSTNPLRDRGKTYERAADARSSIGERSSGSRGEEKSKRRPVWGLTPLSTSPMIPQRKLLV